MSIFRQIGTILFILGAAVVIIGTGAAIFRFDVMSGLGYAAQQDDFARLEFTEMKIVYVSVGTAVFVCASGGYIFLQAVYRSRLRAGSATLLFLGLATI
jgi:hypothetical protein